MSALNDTDGFSRNEWRLIVGAFIGGGAQTHEELERLLDWAAVIESEHAALRLIRRGEIATFFDEAGNHVFRKLTIEERAEWSRQESRNPNEFDA